MFDERIAVEQLKSWSKKEISFRMKIDKRL